MNTVSQPSVSQLLVATCQHKARRECRLWHEAVQQAAKQAVSECDVLDVLIDGYDRWLSVEVHRDGASESFEAREAHELHEEDEPTNEQYQQATKQAEHNWQVIRQVAEGEPLLFRWVNGEVDTSEMKRREWTPIIARFRHPMLDDHTTIAPQPWDIVTAGVINETEVSGLSKPVLADYADKYHLGNMKQSTAVSTELARLNKTDLNQHILQQLNAEFGADTIADLIGKIYPSQVDDDGQPIPKSPVPPVKLLPQDLNGLSSPSEQMMLEFLWKVTTATHDEVIEAVWGPDSTNTAGNIHSLVRPLNIKLTGTDWRINTSVPKKVTLVRRTKT
jgi:hypothetical protein